MRQGALGLGSAALIAAVVCAAAPAAPAFAQATGTTAASAVLRDASGAVVGTATFRQAGNGVAISFQGRGLPAGQHGIHVHETGRCDAPDFATAGGHFNPADRQHGLQNPAGAHAGDLPNLTVGANGNASFNATNTMVTLGAGANSLLKTGGTALVIHADRDDEMTNPSGNSGARIACGVITAGAAALPATGSGSGGIRSNSLLGTAAAGAAAILAGVGTLAARRRVPIR